MTTLYYYTARGRDGAFVRGSIEAAAVSEAVAALRTRALFITSVEAAGTPKALVFRVFNLGPVSKKELVGFFRSFANLTKAGVSIRRSLDVTIAQCSHSRLREALRAVANDIENGLALSEAMARHPNEFPNLLTAMIKAGELGGVLDDVLNQAAVVLEREQAVRKRVAAALAYPLTVAVAAIGLVLFLLTSIVPLFQTMYAQLHVPLPAITVVLIAIGSALRHPSFWAAAAAGLAALVLLSSRAFRNAGRAEHIARILLRVPIVGVLSRKASAARIARTLGTLLHSGVGLMQALEVLGDVVASPLYRRSIAEIRSALKEGAPVSEPLAASNLYEPMFVQFVRVGEETGTLDSMLLTIAEYYDLDVEAALTALSATLEPAMILLLGGAVGFIVSAIFIPLYQLIGNIR